MKYFYYLVLVVTLISIRVKSDELASNVNNEDTQKVSDKNIPVKGSEKLFLSLFIKNGSVDLGKELSRVESKLLPGDILSYSGYFTVDEKHDSNTFFWFFPAEEIKSEDAPLVIWLQGGPGASSLYGLFSELGPYFVNSDGQAQLRKYSWHKHHNLLFIDNPVGAGFSFTDKDGYATNQTRIAEQLYIFIIQFLQVYPEMQKVPLYITGESYAGKHVPSFAYKIHKNNPSAKIKIDLKGIAIGDGYIEPYTMMRYSELGYQLGLIDDKTAKIIAKEELECEESIGNGTYDRTNKRCIDPFNLLMKYSHLTDPYNYANEKGSNLDGIYVEFLNNKEIQKDLHVGYQEFQDISAEAHSALEDFYNSASPWMEELLEHYKVMLYSGQLDLIVAYPLSLRTYRSFKWSGADDYLNATRYPWYLRNTLIGYTKRAKNMIEVLVRNAGHMVPMDQPERGLLLIRSFINDWPMEGEKSEA